MSRSRELIHALQFPKTVGTPWELGKTIALTLTGIGFITPVIEAGMNVAEHIAYTYERRSKQAPTLEEMRIKLPGGIPAAEAGRTAGETRRWLRLTREGFQDDKAEE